jgi:hypothetical protein
MTRLKFEARVFRSVTGDAPDRATARQIMLELNAGLTPAGVVENEESIDDGGWDLVEIDGEPV